MTAGTPSSYHPKCHFEPTKSPRAGRKIPFIPNEFRPPSAYDPFEYLDWMLPRHLQNAQGFPLPSAGRPSLTPAESRNDPNHTNPWGIQSFGEGPKNDYLSLSV